PYQLLGNLNLTKPGSLAVWFSPQGWVHGENEGYFWPVNLIGNVHLMLGRQGQQAKDPKRADMVYAWGQVGALKPSLVISGGSLQWKNGEWHLWVLNWTSGSIEFSLDGAAPQRQDLPARLPADGTLGGQMYIAAQGPE